MNDNVDYGAPAELFPAPNHGRSPLRYHRFEALAEAVRFAHEELTASERAGAVIEADEVRYVGAQIDALYNAVGYPLLRRPLISH
ncbi:MAG: hypothetical protein EOP22_14920 [Hyphomicrobiales bacterium]|nr:MAG: hypothetical protein EOP22_14920 [Hyphomicrobiales bacterium]